MYLFLHTFANGTPQRLANIFLIGMRCFTSSCIGMPAAFPANAGIKQYYSPMNHAIRAPVDGYPQ